eukprot:TRINITY_DN537_c0_g1_i10.p1 TRINITY_DN537_c0_g1~~TRINITY_DN537_c0_g1_i10.p1  ORF type:complete len:778 (+),score=287.05 TRINITY_DN537_c0_g1_i10:1601-3934(+)
MGEEMHAVSVHNDTLVVDPTISARFEDGFSDGSIESNNSIVSWNNGQDGDEYLKIMLDGEIDYMHPATHSFSIELLDLSVPEVSFGLITEMTITLESNYVSYPPSAVLFDATPISDDTMAYTSIGSFTTLDANLDDVDFDYCLLSSAGDRFLLSDGNDNHELSHCIDEIAHAHLVTNSGKSIDAGSYEISIQSCDNRRQCVSETFTIDVALSVAATPVNFEVSTCGRKIGAQWKLTRSVNHITSYEVTMKSTSSNEEICGNNKILVERDSISNTSPPLTVECDLVELSVIACNPSGCSNPSEVIQVELSEEGCQRIVVEDIDGDSVHGWQESALLIANRDDLSMNIKLPIAPLVDELVTIECNSNSEFVLVEPNKVQFNGNDTIWTDGLDISVKVTDDRDHSNGPWTDHEVVCSTSSSSSNGILGNFAGGVVPVRIPVRNMNIILPTMAQIYSQMPDGEWIPTIADDKFDLPVSGAMNVSIVCDEEIPGNHFFPNTRVTVGGVLTVISHISNDGHMINFTTPLFNDVCEEGDKNCGYQQFEILNPEFAQDGSIVEDVACPDLCPAEGQGIFYTEKCVGYESGARCLMPEFADECSFGAGDDCKSCPSGALCPGGYRAWALPGYWTSSETSGKTLRCQPPSTERCNGWNATVGQSQCGHGYMMGSYGCISCDDQFFENTIKTCERCPEHKNSSDKYKPFIYLGLGVLGMGLITMLIIYIAVKVKGGRFSEGYVSTCYGIHCCWSICTSWFAFYCCINVFNSWNIEFRYSFNSSCLLVE